MAGILLLFVFILVITGCSGFQPLVPASLTTATDPAPDSTRTPSPQAAADPTPSITDQTAPAVDETPEVLSFRVVKSYPHDSGAFTEGLVIHEGILYETTGLNGRSTLRQVDLETGRVLRMRSLGIEYFGEGLAVIDDRMVWATWRTNTAFVYDLQTFEVTDEFNYEHEGWGMAYNGTHLYFSDGTDIIHILSPLDYSEVGTLRVSDHGEPVDMINELEFIEGDLYANIWLTTKIARIDPHTGVVTGWLDLEPLLTEFSEVTQSIDVLNGIAYNQDTQQIFVTGKFWPRLFEIQILAPDEPFPED